MREPSDVRRTWGFGSDVSKNPRRGRPGEMQGPGLPSRADCWNAPRRGVARGLALLALCGAVSSCFTNIRPVQCAGQRYRCNEHHDVKFCEYEVLDIAGPDCASVGLATSKHFCVADRGSCIHTHFMLKDRQCDVVSYRNLGEWSECPAEVPIFEDP
jgi:hypothetical protein